MKAADLQNELTHYTITQSGYDTRREYLGMSRISQCPRRLFFEMRDETVWDVESLLRCYKGYQEEKDILARLALVVEMMGAKAILTSEVGELSAFGGQMLGHPDGEIVMLDGSGNILVEIKSTLQEALNRIIEQARIPTSHWWQVQCYLHFGDGWERAFVIYEARDTGMIYVYEAQRDQRMGERIEAKARAVLAALEKGEAPRCECGRCRE